MFCRSAIIRAKIINPALEPYRTLMESYIESLARGAYIASTKLALMPTATKNLLLNEIADAIEARYSEVLEANQKDVDSAVNRALPPALTDRLTLNASRFREMVGGMRQVARLPDPVGRILNGYTVASQLSLMKKSVPFGVVGVIYEARPNVTVDIAALCLKSGNACILRGGSEALNTNRVLHGIMQEILKREGVDQGAITFVDSTDRNDVRELLTLDRYIDVIIPRGGEALHRLCQKESTIPVIVGGFGICHAFVDESADLKRAVDVIINSKVQKPAACNALDTLLLHRSIAEEFMGYLRPLCEEKGIVLNVHGEKLESLVRTLGYKASLITHGREEDFDTEWLSLKLNVAIVDSLDEVLLHLRVHRATHSDSILTNNLDNARRFAANVGSACVYVNAATRFTDGGQFGLGAEVAISTQKLHVRGPMGLEELTAYQWIGTGDYLCRA